MKRNKAFTLSEVLITLAIIGVVASMVIPALQNAQQESQYTVGLKKFYAGASQTMIKLQAPGSEYSFPAAFDWSATGSETLRDGLCTVFDCIKKDTVINIWKDDIYHGNATIYKNYKSNYPIYTDINSYYPAAQLKDGTLIAIKGSQFIVDINGNKKPNMFGKDVYYFELVKNNNHCRLIPGGAIGTSANSFNKKCLANDPGFGPNWSCTYYRLVKPEQMP